jgi:RES domain-containing protein
MRFWRLSHPGVALDRMCAGTARYGGRWNPIGVPALYASASIGLCALEKFVHIGPAPAPQLMLVAVDVPNHTSFFRPAENQLPSGWANLPASAAAQLFGAAWLSGKTELGMFVPSVLVPEESNLVINPGHTDFSRVTLTVIRPFSFDLRMFK